MNLNYLQTMIFMYRINELKKDNENFNDEIATNFEKYVISRAVEIAKLEIKRGIIPVLNKKYSISKDDFEYLVELTGVNVLDKKTVKAYSEIIKEIESNALNNIIETSDVNKKR